MPSLLAAVTDYFVWIESRGPYVGRIWLHPEEAVALRKESAFDPNLHPELTEYFRTRAGGELVGYLFGVQVYSTVEVPQGYIVIAPDGIDARIEGSAAAMKLDLDDALASPEVEAFLTPVLDRFEREEPL